MVLVLIRPSRALAVLALAASACVTLEDRCAAVPCDGDTEVCLDLADGPICVCNAEHEASDTGECVALEPDEAGSDG